MNEQSDYFQNPSESASRMERSTLINCIRRIEGILDEEIKLLESGNLHELDHINLRKSHLLSEFSRLSSSCPENSRDIQVLFAVCRSKASRNYEALGNYLRALEDLNSMILDHLRREETAGTYSRSVAHLSSEY